MVPKSKVRRQFLNVGFGAENFGQKSIIVQVHVSKCTGYVSMLCRRHKDVLVLPSTSIVQSNRLKSKYVYIVQESGY